MKPEQFHDSVYMHRFLCIFRQASPPQAEICTGSDVSREAGKMDQQIFDSNVSYECSICIIFNSYRRNQTTILSEASRILCCLLLFFTAVLLFSDRDVKVQQHTANSLFKAIIYKKYFKSQPYLKCLNFFSSFD